MKRLLSLIVIAGMCTFVACGPSAEEKAKAEKAKQDSLQAIEQTRIADSTAKETAKADSVKQIEPQRIADSTKAAEEQASKAKPAKKGKK
ncbi:MAG: hypothetical protein WCL51_11265 [Bacteroidota bacterium]